MLLVKINERQIVVGIIRHSYLGRHTTLKSCAIERSYLGRHIIRKSCAFKRSHMIDFSNLRKKSPHILFRFLGISLKEHTSPFHT